MHRLNISDYLKSRILHHHFMGTILNNHLQVFPVNVASHIVYQIRQCTVCIIFGFLETSNWCKWFSILPFYSLYVIKQIITTLLIYCISFSKQFFKAGKTQKNILSPTRFVTLTQPTNCKKRKINNKGSPSKKPLRKNIIEWLHFKRKMSKE